MTTEITAIIAEDEPILRAQLKAKLGKLWPELKILADVGDGEAALEAIAAAGADAVLSGHVHDPFDLEVPTAAGPVRLIGAGTLSERVRATRPSFNWLEISGGTLDARVCAMA